MSQAQFIGALLIAIFAVLSTLMIIYRNTYIVKLTWRYALILLPVLLIIIFKLLSTKKTDPNSGSKLDNTINEIKNRLSEAQQVTAIEITAAREEDKVKLEELKRITQIKDDAERRKQLAELMG